MFQHELSPEELARYKAEVIAEARREGEWESDEEYLILQIRELEEYGCFSGEELLEAFDGKKHYWPHW
jgi:hypothetical protein